MLHKYPKILPKKKNIIKIIICAEIVCFFGFSIVWQFLYTFQDCRYYVHKKFPMLLEGYYKLEEKIYNKNIKLTDLTLWQQQNES